MQALLFDLDGTLVDTLGDFVVVLGHVHDALGLPQPSREFLLHTIGRGSEHLIRTCLAHAGAGAERFDEAWALYQREYTARNGEHAEVYPGVRETLALLQDRGLPLACVTNKPGPFATELLRRKGLDGAFAHVFGGEAFARKKPDPMPLLEACRALGTQPGDTWMVGDSSNDAKAAHAAGCPLVLVTYGYNHGENILEVPARAHLDRLDQFNWAAGAAARA
jgi:phosphoglycolate phosphatase